MKADLTPAVERALDHARRLARASGADDLRPAHWLHGLLAEDEGRPAALAVQAGLDWEAYTRDRPMPPDDPADPSVPFQRATRVALSEATGWARLQIAGEAAVSGDLLLIALLRADAELRAAGGDGPAPWTGWRRRCCPNRGRRFRWRKRRRLLTQQIGSTICRILDACANRAREGLRVVEDYCRFVLDDAFLCGELKQLRHNLTTALAGLPVDHLLEARETQRDVGASISTEAEGERASLTAVARANWKRLQEALRSLEEYGKTIGPDLGRALEQLRYRTYTLERSAGLGAVAQERLADVRLCVLLTAAHCTGSPEGTIREAAAGGAGMIQLREKDLSDRELLERAPRGPPLDVRGRRLVHRQRPAGHCAASRGRRRPPRTGRPAGAGGAAHPGTERADRRQHA